MMRPNANVLYIISLVITMIMLSWSSYFLTKEILKHSDYRYIGFYSNKHKTFPKVLVIGNSRAGSNISDVAFQPGDLLNLGMGGTSFGVMSNQAIDMIELNPKLKFVVVEANFLSQHTNKNAISGHGYIQALFSKRVKEYVWASFSHFEKFTAMLFPSYWLNTQNLIGALYYVVPNVPPADEHSNDRTLELKRYGALGLQRVKAITYPPISPDTITLLKALKQVCEKSRVSLRILATPIHQLRWESPGWRKHLLDIKTITSNLGIVFYDYSESLVGEDMFSDTVHLNRSGANYMSEVLLRMTLESEGSVFP